MKKDNYKLCYVQGGQYLYEGLTLYFTSQDIDKQWGDGWSKRPYEHNSSAPYTEDYTADEMGVENGKGIYPKVDIYCIKLETDIRIFTPCTNAVNSNFSVQDINSGMIPWLIIEKNDKRTSVTAGTTYKDFIHLVKSKFKQDIQIFVPLEVMD